MEFRHLCAIAVAIPLILLAFALTEDGGRRLITVSHTTLTVVAVISSRAFRRWLKRISTQGGFV